MIHRGTIASALGSFGVFGGANILVLLQLDVLDLG